MPRRKPSRSADKTPKLAKRWRDLLGALPGYDPFRDAGASWFDPAAAQGILDFFPSCIRHVEGALAGQPFRLERWQQAFVANLIGWKRRDQQGRVVRRYREAFLYVPRKNGKTPLVAGIALYIFFCDPELGQQDFIAAGDREQASMLFRQAKGMVEQSPELSAACKIYGGGSSAGQSKSIVRESDGSFLRVISADAHTKHGGNPHLIIVDELHAQPNRDLIDVLETSMASANRASSLFIAITAADFARPSICNEKLDVARKVRDGIMPDASLLPVIYEAAKDDDWKDPKTWAKANPNLGISVSEDYLRSKCQKAVDVPGFENTFKRLHLDLQTEQADRAIAMDRWDQCAGSADPIAWRREMLEALAGKTCFGGLDLGSTADLTALALWFPQEDGPAIILPYYWVPRDAARTRTQRDRVDYDLWIRQGFVTPTEGNTTDYDQVRRDVNAIAERFLLSELAVDRLFQGAQLCTQLGQDGLPIVAFGQGFFSMAAPCKRILELILDRQIRHGGNPVLRWNAANAATEQDAAGNLKFSKAKSTERIDGLVGATMALGRAMLQAESVAPTINWI